MRASFAKGRCVRGTYVPSDRAAEITKSRSFTKPSRVLARFSVGGGNPKVADTDKLVLRGFSFRLGDDDHRSDILVQSAPVHFARTLDQMLAFLKARIPGPDGKPDMKKVRAFSAANPETLHQANYIAARPLPGSFAGTTYWGVHAFPATNSKGETRFIKFKVAPVGGDVTLTEDEAKAKSADFLHDDLENRIAAGDVRFNVMALLDRPGDPVMDVTIRWPDEDSREAVRLGTIVITGVEAERGVRRLHLQSGKSRRRHRSSAGRDLCGAPRRLRHLTGEASLIRRSGNCRGSGLAFRSALRFTAPRSRADADHGRKHPRKVALIGKPGRYRNLGQRQVADGHQLLGRLHALAKQPLVRRQAGGDSKCA